MPHYTVSIDEDGSVMVDDAAPRELAPTFGRRFGPGRARYCAVPRPHQLAPLPPPAPPNVDGPTLRVHSLYHHSLTDGPGRRSTVKLQGCSIGIADPCPGCIVPDTHEPTGGRCVTVGAVADALTAPAGAPRDGYSLLGGEPLDQARGVAALVAALRAREPAAHVVLYSGYTLAELLARHEPWVDRVLAAVDVLIDGRYRPECATGAGPYRGSTNQQIYGRAELAAALDHVRATASTPEGLAAPGAAGVTVHERRTGRNEQQAHPDARRAARAPAGSTGSRAPCPAQHHEPSAPCAPTRWAGAGAARRALACQGVRRPAAETDPGRRGEPAMMASRRQGAWAGAVSTPRRPITLTHLRGQAACGLRGAALFPALCALYTPGAWSRLCACYPLCRPGDEVRAVAVLLEAFEEHDVVPVMDASTRAWVQEERAAWGEADGGVEDGDPDDGVPFWVHVIPLTNDATVYHCDPVAASTAELLLALLMADDMDEREEAAATVTGRLAHLSGVTQTRVAAVLSCAAPVHRAMMDLAGGGLVDPLYDALCRDAAGAFRALPDPLSRVGTLCSYMAGSYDNPFLCPSDEMWEATGLETYAWSLDNVACCVAWWADARPVVTTARAVLDALKAPGALERLLPALTAALAHACQRAGYGYPPAPATAHPSGIGDG